MESTLFSDISLCSKEEQAMTSPEQKLRSLASDLSLDRTLEVFKRVPAVRYNLLLVMFFRHVKEKHRKLEGLYRNLSTSVYLIDQEAAKLLQVLRDRQPQEVVDRLPQITTLSLGEAVQLLYYTHACSYLPVEPQDWMVEAHEVNLLK
jgi:hypothetical protein